MNTMILGIDEAGRGPWAGPLVVAGILVSDENILSEMPFLNDSKKVSEKNRQTIFEMLFLLKKQGKIDFFIVEKSAEDIDTFGIREANRQAMNEIILHFLSKRNTLEETCEILIDGADNFIFDDIDAEYVFAKKKKKSEKIQDMCENFVNISDIGEKKNVVNYIIGGDAKYPVISASSILAKVHRDTIMKRFGKQFPQYGFEKHKGYGTVFHKNAILNYGINFLHRKSYEPIKTLISLKN